MNSHELARKAIREEDLIGRRFLRGGEYIILNDYISQQERLALLVSRIINLSHHPYFPEIPDLPAWKEAIAELESAISYMRD
jgi:hypothetical protein